MASSHDLGGDATRSPDRSHPNVSQKGGCVGKGMLGDLASLQQSPPLLSLGNSQAFAEAPFCSLSVLVQSFSNPTTRIRNGLRTWIENLG